MPDLQTRWGRSKEALQGKREEETVDEAQEK